MAGGELRGDGCYISAALMSQSVSDGMAGEAYRVAGAAGSGLEAEARRAGRAEAGM